MAYATDVVATLGLHGADDASVCTSGLWALFHLARHEALIRLDVCTGTMELFAN